MKDTLENKEKIIVWVANLVNPVIAGFLFYYSWKNKFPNKARQANTISFIVIGVEFLIYVLIKYFIKVNIPF